MAAYTILRSSLVASWVLWMLAAPVYIYTVYYMHAVQFAVHHTLSYYVAGGEAIMCCMVYYRANIVVTAILWYLLVSSYKYFANLFAQKNRASKALCTYADKVPLKRIL